MNIYKRQMNNLGLNLEQYSQMLEIPKSITKKIINGNGEVVEDMEINNFLRKNMFSKHQEIENNKEEKQVEAMNLQMKEIAEKRENVHPKVEYLLREHPDSKEVKWYLEEFDKKIYFSKHKIANYEDLMNRYDFQCDVGRLKGKRVGTSTIQRLLSKEYDEMGMKSMYSLICQLYDCLELGNIKSPNKSYYNSKKGQKGFRKRDYNEEEMKLVNWYKEYDFKKFFKEKHINFQQFSDNTGVAVSSIPSVKAKLYVPRYEVLIKIKNFVDKMENNEPKIQIDERTAIISEESIMQPMIEGNVIYSDPSVTVTHYVGGGVVIENTLEKTQEEMLRELLRNRLTDEEKMLITLFGGRYDS